MNKNILVAPLNWGLGHATRCIPIIRALETEGFSPILASDGVALEILRKEFPQLPSIELPSYHIEYPKKRIFF
ncbi:glycosyl transferase [Flavobacterium psychrophilum]|nr:glycosyl transferase [Flavobacterium psychrophilum]